MFAWKRLVLAVLTLVMWVHPTLERILEPSPECYSFVESRSSYLLYTRKSFSGLQGKSVKNKFLFSMTTHMGYVLVIQYQCIIQLTPKRWMPITVMKQEGAVAVRVGSEAVVTVQQSAESHMAEIGNRVTHGIRKWTVNNTIEKSVYSVCKGGKAINRPYDMHVMFVFVSAVLLGSSSAEPDGADWTLSVELALRTVSARGSLLILVDTQNDYILSLKLNHPSQVTHRNYTLRSYPQALCSGEKQLVIGMGVTKATMKLTDGDYELLKRVLSQPGSMVYLGGGPGEN
uniref:Uncharacterized protein n=1 Tax=Oncorhynchus tshawytscha TaxID=74940 RepID=A0AAZ3PDS0_ONCTS